MKTSLFDKDIAAIFAIASVNRYTSRKLFVLYAIATLNQPSMPDIKEATTISIPALSRIIHQLRTNDGINIIYRRIKGTEKKKISRGNNGYYFIESWGNLNSKKFLSTFKKEVGNLKSPGVK